MTEDRPLMTAEERLALDEVRRLEPLFHAGPAIGDHENFRALTAPDFRQVGASGRAYAREQVWDALAARSGAGDDAPFETSGWHCRQVGGDTFLVTYVLRHGERVSRRLSVWERVFPGWRAVYHQGTLVEEGVVEPPGADEGAGLPAEETGVPLEILVAEAERVWRDPGAEVAVVFLTGRAVAGWIATGADGVERLHEGAVIPDTSSAAMERAITAARERRRAAGV